ncbi:MAG: hypothetical protein F4Z74_03875 [Acidobacteria bacterium]|nr:hypothetical protein [Acidobacteriota bacterium]MYE43628.1 hypothetical protein [Acidobacteriota bacterium]
MQPGTAHRPSAGYPREGGFSLVETLFAVLVLVVAAGSLMRALSQASQARRAAADTGLATRIAEARMEELLAAPFSRGWPWPGYHAAVAPGGTVEIEGAGAPGYVAYFGEEGEPADRRSARYEVRWRIRELAPRGGDRLAGLRIEVVATPVAGGRGSVVRLESIRVANRE